jgi:DNA helicase-2/ATP-dependent DNA helicase PcrA
MALTYEQLNGNQQTAADWGDGPILVLAGPGSGKTAVLTLRIARLIKATPEENFKVLGLTFTVRAANEMNKRLLELLGVHSQRVQLKTFHSFCSDLLRQHGSHLGLKPDFSVITDDKDRTLILKDINDRGEVLIDDPEDTLKKIDKMFIRGILPEELESYFEPDKIEQCNKLRAIFNSYIEALLLSNQLDFGSMIYFAHRVLSTKKRIANQIRTVYNYICVDEFQDTNLAQYQILKQIAPDETSNLFVVADDDQVIFQWNGADPKRLQELKLDYKPEIVQLPENYRCPGKIVAIANLLIKHNADRIDSKIAGVSHNSDAGAISLMDFKDAEQELDGLAAEIVKIEKSRRSTCLVIARTNQMLVKAKQVLLSHDIEAEIVSKSQDFFSAVFKFLYLILKLYNSPESKSILNKLCAVATSLNGITLSAEEIATQSSVDGSGLLRTFFNYASISAILEPVCTLADTTLFETINYREFAKRFLEYFELQNPDLPIDERYPDYSSDKSEWERISHEIKLTHGEHVGLHIFLQEMDLTPKEKSLPRTCVRLQTVHTAKGMEFEHVYVIGLAEDQFPTYFAIKNGKSAVEEERRNCFVAITRASRTLYLSYARKYNGWSKEPSRFLREMGLLGKK